MNVFLLTSDVIHFGTGLITDVSRGQVHHFMFFVYLNGACIPKSMVIPKSIVIQKLIGDVR